MQTGLQVMVDRLSAGQAGASCKDSLLAGRRQQQDNFAALEHSSYVPSWTAAAPSISWPNASVTRPAARSLQVRAVEWGSRKTPAKKHYVMGDPWRRRRHSKAGISRSRPSYGPRVLPPTFLKAGHIGHRVEQKSGGRGGLVASGAREPPLRRRHHEACPSQ